MAANRARAAHPAHAESAADHAEIAADHAEIAAERWESGMTEGAAPKATDQPFLRQFAPSAFHMEEIAPIRDARWPFLRRTARWAIHYPGFR